MNHLDVYFIATPIGCLLVEIVITLALASTLLVGVLLVGFIRHRFELLAAFIPAGTPLGIIPLMILLELLAYCTRTLSLGLRLAVNMITGHILAKVCVGFIWVAVYVDSPNVLVLVLSFPMLLLTLFLGLEVLIAYLQAYIFTFITCITIKDMTVGLLFIRICSYSRYLSIYLLCGAEYYLLCGVLAEYSSSDGFVYIESLLVLGAQTDLYQQYFLC